MLRCKGYENCEYKNKCEHSVPHVYIKDLFDNCDSYGNKDCQCVNTNLVRKDKLEKIIDAQKINTNLTFNILKT